MHILLTNDDGIFAPGLAAMYDQLTKIGQVSVVAPADSRSGASHSISLQPLICQKVDLPGSFSGYSVQGSPADCVKLAVMELVHSDDTPIDIVVSGINHGANVGINIYYSGTVAAAMEAAFYRIPAVAVSAALEDNMNIEKSAEHASNVINKLLPLAESDVINVNIPWLSIGEPKGVKVLPQATAGFQEKYIVSKNQHGQVEYQLTGGDHREDKNSYTDTIALVEGYITVTALKSDMTNHEKNENLKKRLAT
jgi:5'-nucleotidase